MNTWLNAVVGVGARCIVPLRVTLLICLALLVQPIAAQDECIPADGESIILGAIFPEGNLLTRRDGESYQGAEAMRQAINACGGVNGRPVEFMYEPANDRDEAAESAQRLVEAGVPLIVGSGSQAVSEGAREVTEAAGVIYWEMTESLDDAGEWSFSSRPNNWGLGFAAAEFVLTTIPTSNDAPRIALVHEARARGQQIAEGVMQMLELVGVPAIIEYSYSDILYETNDLAERIRDEQIDVLIFSGFDEDGEYLWYALREANANIKAWLQVGSEGYGREWCERGGNMQGFISIDATGPISTSYRQAWMGEVYTLYRRTYLNEYGTEPSYNADLSAIGIHELMSRIAPFVEGDYTSEAIRAASNEFVAQQARMYGEETGFNVSGVVVRQQQGSFFCSVWPQDIATCAAGVQPFPTWRERALLEQNPAICTGDGI